jgi:wyosine [tRNA(Phe)-imidazoG37] synthetase (radical SAM superfamily)
MRTQTPHVFGPVPSRRLGQSLGVNNLDGKHCTYSCIYCQAGPTECLSDSRRTFVAPVELRDEVEAALGTARTKGIPVDFVSFVPTGEPTLDAGLGAAIAAIKQLGARVAVFTNGSLLWRADVRDELALADWVSVKVDAASDAVWRRVNRPHGRLSFETVLDGVRQFAHSRGGTLVTETMLVASVNDTDEEIDALSREIAALAPSVAWLATPVRPPAEPWVGAPSALGFERALRVFTRRISTVLPLAPRGSEQWLTLDPEGEHLLAMAAVHPLSQAELEHLLRSSDATWATVDALLDEGRLETVEYGGQRFYRSVWSREPPAPIAEDVEEGGAAADDALSC